MSYGQMMTTFKILNKIVEVYCEEAINRVLFFFLTENKGCGHVDPIPMQPGFVS